MEQKCILANHDGDTNDSVTKNRFNKQNMVLQCAMRIFVHFSPLVCKILLDERDSQWRNFRILFLELNAVITYLAWVSV